MLPVIGERRCFIVICRIFIANILSQYKWLWGWIQCFTHLPVICKFLSLNASVGTLQFNCGGTSSLMTHTTQRPESHGLGQNFEGWAGSMCPQENTWGCGCPCNFCTGYRAHHVKTSPTGSCSIFPQSTWAPCPKRWDFLCIHVTGCQVQLVTPAYNKQKNTFS